MAKNIRTDIKDITRGSVIALPVDHPDAIHLHPNDYIAVKGGSIDYSKYLNSNPYAYISTPDTLENQDILAGDPITIDEMLDIPSLSDIESVVYEPYYDTVSKLQKVRALIKIRNSSKNPTNIAGVDARIFNPSTIVPVVSNTSTTKSVEFITPSPGVPNVVFKRDSTAIAWGWDNVSGLGSYSSVSYEWIISSSSGASAATLDSGTLTYSTSTSKQIGIGGSMKQYRVSSRDGNTSATSSSRWLRVRTVVVGTNGTTYRSSYSTPI